MADKDEVWTQEQFNNWVAQWDEIVTYQDVRTEAYTHNLDPDEAIAFAAKENLG